MMSETYEFYRRGMDLLESGDPAQAAVLLERAKRLEPNKASIREALGRAYCNHGRYRLAGGHFAKALALDPTNDYAHFGLAFCLARIGEFGRASGHIKMALVMSPENEAYRRLAGRLAAAAQTKR